MAVGEVKPGIYNTDYYSGAQCAVYIGDVWVDEITSISYQVQQARAPLYGYADTLFRDVAEGKVLVNGTFTINFKEAGYLFLILDRYRQIVRNLPSIMGSPVSKEEKQSKVLALFKSPNKGEQYITKETIETILNNDGRITRFQRNQILNGLAEYHGKNKYNINKSQAWSSLSGFPVINRSDTAGTKDENPFEAFEDAVWKKTQDDLDQETRRIDDPRLNPFDIYLTFGDFASDNSVNHTIKKLSNVYVFGQSQQVVIDGQPIQEAYQFIARNVV